MATWTDPTTIKAGVTNGKPGIGTGGFGDQVADDLQYLYDQVVGSIGIASSGNIYDDFHQAALDTDNWTELTGSSSVTMHGTDPDHAVEFSHPSGGYAGIVASAKKMRFDLDRDHHIRMKCRWGKATSSGDQVVTIGFNDASLATNTNATIVTTDSMIAFRRGTNANTLKAYCSKTAGNNTTIADNLGTWTSYMILEIEITFIGATKKVEFFVDGASVGSTTDTAKIPIIAMRPTIGDQNGSGSRTSFCDRAAYFWVEEPKST